MAENAERAVFFRENRPSNDTESVFTHSIQMNNSQGLGINCQILAERKERPFFFQLFLLLTVPCSKRCTNFYLIQNFQKI
mgnify:CR=1 FL=1